MRRSMADAVLVDEFVRKVVVVDGAQVGAGPELRAGFQAPHAAKCRNVGLRLAHASHSRDGDEEHTRDDARATEEARPARVSVARCGRCHCVVRC